MTKRNISRASKDALREYKSSEEERNHNNLVMAFNRLVNNTPDTLKKGSKLSVASVAKEAGLSRGAVYLHHDILDKINAYKANPTGSDFQRRKAIKDAEAAKEGARKSLIKQLQIDKHNLAQENFRLSLELKGANEKLAELSRQLMTGKVVTLR